MNRKEELLKIINNEPLLVPLVNEVMQIEQNLKELHKLPFYKTNPNNELQQKILPAFRMYKELLQQYTNCIKVLSRASGIDDKDEESPLRKWVNSRLNAD